MTTGTASFVSGLKRREEVAENTMAFYLERPPGFEFRAGQSVDVTLANPPETDAEGNIRTFSIASAPSAPELLFATRLRNTAFKRVLKAAPPGTQLRIEGPMGSFTLHKNAARAAVFLAGGIGITPFLSILSDAAERKLPHRLYLFYSNRRPEDAAFLPELEALQRANPNFRFVPNMSQMERSQREWRGETGFIDGALVSRYVTPLQGPVYYIAGPPAMVGAMRQMLTDAGVEEDDIRTEEFAGY